MADDFPRIRGNIEKMLAQNAPESDIDTYLQSERLTADEFRSVATGKMKLGDVRMTQKSQGEIGKELSKGKTIAEPGIGRGQVLPWSKVEATGEVFFDPDAGLLGMFKRGAMTPGDVAMGNLDPQSEEGARRTAEMAMGFTPMSAATRATEATLPGALKSLRVGQPKVPTADELRLAGKAGMTQARNMGVDYSADAVKSLGDDIARSLEASGMFAETAPKTFSLLSKVRDIPTEAGATTVSSLDNLITLRRVLQKHSADPTEQAASQAAINAIDNFVMAADPQSVVAGPAAAAAGVVKDARGNFAANFRSQALSDSIEQAERDTAAAGSGLNLDNRTRQIVNAIIKSDKESRGFSKEELGLLDEIVRGKRGTNLARYFGNLLGGGGGLGTTFTAGIGAGLGHLIGGPVGGIVGAGAPSAAGISLRKLAGALTQQGVRNVDDLTRRRSPLFEQNSQNLPVTTHLSPEVVSSFIKAMFAAGLQPSREGAR